MTIDNRTCSQHWHCRNLLSKVAPLNGDPFWAAEIGVASGGNAERMLFTYPSLRLYMIDPWTGDEAYLDTLPKKRMWSESLKTMEGFLAEEQEWYEAAVNKTEFASNRRIILRMPSSEAAMAIPDGLLSFCFIDGDHRYAAVTSDLNLYYQKVRVGGIFAGHDFARYNPGVWKAVTEWSSSMGIIFQRMGRSTWWLVKERR